MSDVFCCSFASKCYEPSQSWDAVQIWPATAAFHPVFDHTINHTISQQYQDCQRVWKQIKQHEEIKRYEEITKAAKKRQQEFNKHANETISDWANEMRQKAVQAEGQPLSQLGRACLMFKVLTDIKITEEQAEKFLNLVKVCEGNKNDQL